MGVNTAKKTGKTAKKTVSGSKPKPGSRVRKPGPLVKRAAGGKNSEIKEAILSMTASIARTDAKIAETNAKTDASIEKLARAQAETSAKTDASIEKLARVHIAFEDLERTQKASILAMEKTTSDLAASMEETRRELRKTTSDLAESVAKSIKELGGNVGDVNNRLGEIVEMMVLSGLMDKMNEMYGYQFDNVASDKIFKDNGQQYAEVDLFIENGDSVMAVEAKARVREGNVNKLVTTLQKLREHEVKAGLAGKTIYGAIAGIVFDAGARRVAEKNGLYLVDIDQNNDRITIDLPAGTAGKW